jgi:hypothetical protein
MIKNRIRRIIKMNNVINLLAVLIALLIFNGGCVSHSSKPQKDPEVVNRINEILNNIATQPGLFQLRAGVSSYLEDHKKGIAEDCRSLIENPNLALPMMFKRLDNREVSNSSSLAIYFIVFEYTKSTKSISYIADYLDSGKEESQYNISDVVSGPGAALSAAQHITLLKLVDDKHAFFGQRKEIADALRQWYEDYKKKQDKNKQ